MKKFQLLGISSSRHKHSNKHKTRTDEASSSLLGQFSSSTESLLSVQSSHESQKKHHMRRYTFPAAESLHLTKLPEKLFFYIIDLLADDIPTLLALCLVNKQFSELVSRKYLYKHVVMHSKLSLLKFNISIHSNENAKKRFSVNKIEFLNPECQDSMLKYGRFYKKSSTPVMAGSFEIQDSIPTLHSAKNQVKSGNVFSSSSSSTSSYFSGLFSRPENEKLLHKYSRYTYIELLLDIIDYLPNLEHIALNDIDPGFMIPPWYSVLNDGTKEFFNKILKNQESMTRDDLKSFKLSKEWIENYQTKYYSLPRYKTLELVGRTKQMANCLLKPFYFYAFGVFEELILENIDISSQSLECPFELLPLQMKLDKTGYLDIHSPVSDLTLNNCNIVVNHGIFKNLHDYFSLVRSLTLLNLKNSYDLLLSNCFPLLQNLTIDCNSLCFISDESVKDSYYLASKQKKQADLQRNDAENHNFNGNGNEDAADDMVSLTDTLIDPLETRSFIKYPPPTTPVIVTYDLASTNLNKINMKDTEKGGKVTKHQLDFFRSLNISNFYLNYHKFHKLWMKLPNCSNINVKIVNIPFTNVFPVSPSKYLDFLQSLSTDDQVTVSAQPLLLNEEDKEYWWEESIKKCFTQLMSNDAVVENEDASSILDSTIINGYRDLCNYKDIPNINLWFFLTTLSKFKSVEIHMLRQWLFCTPRSRYDWELLLRPLLNGETPIKVRDRCGYVLYSYGCNKTKNTFKNTKTIN